MKNSEEAAYPPDPNDQYKRGLTKRELFAAIAMQGWLASFGADAEITPTGKVQVAALAVELADALIAELEAKP